MLRKIVNLQGTKVLSRKELNLISGGQGTCAINWNGQVFQGLSLYNVERAMGNMSEGDTFRWCCDSCGDASWL